MSSSRRREVRVDGAVGVRHGGRARRLTALALALCALGLAAVALGAVAPAAPALAALVPLALALAVGVGAALAWRVDRAPGVLELTEAGVALERDGARQEIPWSSVARWRMHPRGEAEEVVFEGMDGDAYVAVLATEDQSAEVLAAARGAEARRTLVVTLCPAVRTWRENALVLSAVLAAVGMNTELDAAGSARLGLVTTLAALAAMGWLLRLRDVARVAVGTDGVAIARGGSLRFVPYRAMADVDWDEFGVLIRLTDGAVVALPLVSPQGLRDARDATVARLLARRDALHDRVRAELGRWRAGVAAEDPAGGVLLDRHGRSLPVWRAGLRELVSTAGAGYRRVAMDREEVARIVEDPRAPVERRVAAALALAPGDDPCLRARVRAALDACALEPVRVAIDRAACGELDEATLDTALSAAGERGI